MQELTNLSLTQLGWNSFFQKQIQLDDNSDKASEDKFTIARVIRQDRSGYQLISASAILSGSLPGKFRLEYPSKAQLPAVGDWVLVSPADESNPQQVLIQRTLERLSKFSRKEAGEKLNEQVVAANIDTVFIVTGLDANFNAKRIERYLLLSQDSGASAVIILNKVDLCTDLEQKLEEVKAIAKETPIVVISALENRGMAALKPWTTEGSTVAVLGSSGVGKSSIINQLLGYDHFKIADVRESDSKGRHTTTHRELCVISNGGLIMDTPGMREIQLWTDKDSVAPSFDDIEAIAESCKFRDCAHEAEPKCAIKLALEDGSLARTRFESYQKFQQELTLFEKQQSTRLRADKNPTHNKGQKKGR